MVTIEELQLEKKIQEYRNKWLVAKKCGDTTMCNVIERCVKALKIGAKLTLDK